MFCTKMCPWDGTKYGSFELYLGILRGPGEGRGGGPCTIVPLQNPRVTSWKACLRNAEDSESRKDIESGRRICRVCKAGLGSQSSAEPLGFCVRALQQGLAFFLFPENHRTSFHMAIAGAATMELAFWNASVRRLRVSVAVPADLRR